MEFLTCQNTSQKNFINFSFTESLAGFGVAAVIWYGGHQVMAGETTKVRFFHFWRDDDGLPPFKNQFLA